MFINGKALNGYKFKCLDGEIGKVKDFYFDDRHWAIRYLVVETGSWLLGKQVLISPWALGGINKETKHITVNLTKKQIEDSPLLGSDLPVSRQFEQDYYAYYGWPMYWSGRNMWGATPHLARRDLATEESIAQENNWDLNLRSAQAVDGYRMQAKDGEIGHVADFIIEDESWAIRYLIIDTRNWLPGKKVLIAPQWVEKIDWSDSRVIVDLSCKSIESAPEYSLEALPSRDYEIKLHTHYNLPGYWEVGHVPNKPSDLEKAKGN